MLKDSINMIASIITIVAAFMTASSRTLKFLRQQVKRAKAIPAAKHHKQQIQKGAAFKRHLKVFGLLDLGILINLAILFHSTNNSSVPTTQSVLLIAFAAAALFCEVVILLLGREVLSLKSSIAYIERAERPPENADGRDNDLLETNDH